MEFGVLGPLRVAGPDGPVTLTAPKHRALLAMLLLSHREGAVPAERLIDAVWDDPPASAHKILQVYISQLRRALGDGRPIVTRAPGYAIELQPGQLDLDRFEALTAQARERPAEAAVLLREALALFRGPPLADAPLHGPAATEADRLDGLRLAALEQRIDADLALGRHTDLIGELEALAAEHPYRERLHGQLMVALYRSGRQADALAAYRRARERLIDDLGIEPSPALRELEAAVLAQDPSLEARRRGGGPAEPGGGEAHAAAPASRASAAPVPQPLTPLLGRDDELGAADAFLADPAVRLLTLTGPGGIGKSRLGLELAHRHGGRFVALAAVDEPELVIPALAQALGAVEHGDEPPFAALTAALGAELVVLDNLEQVLDAAPDIARLLAAVPGLRLVATSRAPLRIAGERELALAPLAIQPAVELYRQRARTPGGDDQVVAAICERLDRLPLAIELAAARTNVLTAEQILGRLSQRLDLLTAGRRDLPARQQTLRAAIDWSHDLLEPDAQRLFAALGVFAGGWTLEAAEAVCGPGVLDGLAALVDQSLVTHAGERFGMLETVREYALERTGDDVRRRHAQAFVALTRDAEPGLHGPDAQAWLHRLDAERANVRAALEFATAAGDAETATALVANVWRYWLERANLSEGRALAEAALALRGEPSPARVRALRAAGALAAEQGDFAAARDRIEDALRTAEEIGDGVGAAHAGGNLGNLALYAGDPAEAVRRYRAVADFMRETGDDWGLSLMLQNLGIAHAGLDQLEPARALLRESVTIARRVADPMHLASTLRTLARVELRAGADPGAAIELLHECLAILRDVDQRQGIAEALETLAALAEPATGARLLGAAEATRAAVGAIRAPDEDAWVEDLIASLRATLGDDEFAAARQAGRALLPDEAIASGLSSRLAE
jgi:predicted ATPase/DNA-binding SARP family transcriptional activator